MKRLNGKLNRNEKGNGLLEFAAVSIVVIPLFFGMVGAGIQLGRMDEAVQICRDSAHMYARGVDFTQTANKNILVSLATGSGMTVSGGTGVVMMSQIIQVYLADCTAAGLTAGGVPTSTNWYSSTAWSPETPACAPVTTVRRHPR
jgi:hypothetical protein